MIISHTWMLGLRPWYLGEMSDIFSPRWKVPTTGTGVFLSIQSTSGRSFAFPSKSELRNALLPSTSGCLRIETLSSVAILPVAVNTVYDKNLLILYCSQLPRERIQWPPRRKRSQGTNRQK